VRNVTLGKDLVAGERPQVVIDRDEWQRATSLGDWTLVGCTVAPGFEFAEFEMMGEGWMPEGA
jgi:predicted cupin superfamily sugar epimerase